MKQNQFDILASNPDLVLVGGSIKGFMGENGRKNDLWMVKRSAIRVIENFNVRVNNQALKDHIRNLANSMKVDGFLREHPLVGYVNNEGGELVTYLTDGHNRLAAFDLAVSEGAEMDEVPMIVNNKSNSEDLVVGLVTHNSGKPLTVLEKAFVCKRLTSFNWEPKRIADRLGFSTPAYVEDLLLLVGAPSDVVAMVAEDEVSAATAIDMLKKNGNKAPQMLKDGLERAKADGKAKLTKRFTTDPGLKFVTRSAPTLFSTVKEISADPAFQQLDPALRQKIEAVMTDIAEQTAKATQPKPVKPAKLPKAAKQAKPVKEASAAQVARPKAAKKSR